jgi:hypothetical protein
LYKKCHVIEQQVMSFFLQKTDQKYYGAKLIFRSLETLFGLTIFRSGATQKFLFAESMSVLDQNGRTYRSWSSTLGWLIGHSSVKNFLSLESLLFVHALP